MIVFLSLNQKKEIRQAAREIQESYPHAAKLLLELMDKVSSVQDLARYQVKFTDDNSTVHIYASNLAGLKAAVENPDVIEDYIQAYEHPMKFDDTYQMVEV
jgi:hypothetical protein